ncbi:hypothetical protein AB0953_22075 [Streptomyces sp. NPDC046866]|uniref:hypothetical protein n=1 Tax=Streptomyces sp. NPDC046866 TaxID=3154921 RepID=UPI0034572DA7
MSGGFRYRVERVALALMAASGVVVLLADLFGWLDALAPGGALPKVTLLILSTVTVFLLLEIDRLRKLDDVQERVEALDSSVHSRVEALDGRVQAQVALLGAGIQEKVTDMDAHMQAHLSKLDIDAMSQRLKDQHYGGVVKVHRRFPEEEFIGYVEDTGQEVAILQTWIPNLRHLEEALVKALVAQQVPVRILLLDPASPVAGLRNEALKDVLDPALAEDVKARVEGCLAGLARIHRRLAPGAHPRLQVKVYNSLPSIAVFKADERYLVSSFLHGQLAVDSTQIEVDGAHTLMGREVQEEFDTLWSIGVDVDLPDWRTSLDNNRR